MTIYIKILILCSLIIYKAHSLNDDSVSVSKPEFSISHFQKTIRFLGSDFLEGRGTGTQGGNLAAKYLAQEFDRIGLIPIGDNGSFYQKIPMLGSKQQQDSKLKCCLAWDTVNFILFKDYALLKSGEETFIPNPLPLAFAGYGIIAPEYDYNDYQNLDVKDKIVVILDGEPSSEDRAFFDGDKETIHSIYESKLRAALSRGAAGVVIVPLLNPGRKNWDDIMNEYKFEDVILAYNPSSNLGLLMNPKSAEVLFKDSGYALSDIYKMHIEKRLWSFPLKAKLSFRGDFQQRSFIADNIIGMLEGSNPKLKDTYLIISAHYDHLGIGPAIGGDSIYNGV
ncbi:MAG: family peptidase, partial [Bacteroidota bacterium]|nr:family peptidase [Bacteroidota bacterium]